MNELIQPSTPLWMNILLISLTVAFPIFMCSFFFTAITRNEKLGEFTLKASMTSFFLCIGLIMISVLIVDYMISNPNAYTITKTDDTIRVNSKSNWVANSTYNILEYKNGVYYLEDPTHPKNLIKISDSELDKMIAKE